MTTYPSKKGTKQKLERDIQKDILSRLNLIGGCWFKIQRANDNGAPDIIGWYQGRSYAIEIKKPDGKTSLLQEIALENIKKSGGDSVITAVCTSLKEIIELLGLNERG